MRTKLVSVKENLRGNLSSNDDERQGNAKDKEIQVDNRDSGHV